MNAPDALTLWLYPMTPFQAVVVLMVTAMLTLPAVAVCRQIWRKIHEPID